MLRYKLVCNSCGYAKGVLESVTICECDIKVFLNNYPEILEKVNGILKKHPNSDVRYGRHIAVCDSCGNVTYLKYVVIKCCDKIIYETKYQCRCNGSYKFINHSKGKSILRCPKCKGILKKTLVSIID